MAEVKCTLEELPKLIEEDLRRMQTRVQAAIAKTAQDAINPIYNNAPKAFGILRDSIKATPDSTVVDAPHASAVETGTGPAAGNARYMPPLEPILKWVKLRGMQYLNMSKRAHFRGLNISGPGTSRTSLSKSQRSSYIRAMNRTNNAYYGMEHGPTTRRHAMTVGRQLNRMVVRPVRTPKSGSSLGKMIAQSRRANTSRGRFTPIDAPTQIANEIRMSIYRAGTKPTWFVKKTLPEIMKFLDDNIKAFIGD